MLFKTPKWRISGVIDGGLENASVEKVPMMKIRLLWRTTVEVVSLLQRMSNTRKTGQITLDVEMEDYYRIKGDR